MYFPYYNFEFNLKFIIDRRPYFYSRRAGAKPLIDLHICGITRGQKRSFPPGYSYRDLRDGQTLLLPKRVRAKLIPGGFIDRRPYFYSRRAGAKLLIDLHICGITRWQKRSFPLGLSIVYDFYLDLLEGDIIPPYFYSYDIRQGAHTVV